MLDEAWNRLKAGETVQIRPHGGSMVGLVPSGSLVEVVPCQPDKLEIEDVVLVRVKGTVYLHKVLGLELAKQRILIGNNRGGTNGWTSFTKVAGIAASVNGKARPRLAGKTNTPGN